MSARSRHEPHKGQIAVAGRRPVPHFPFAADKLDFTGDALDVVVVDVDIDGEG